MTLFAESYDNFVNVLTMSVRRLLTILFFFEWLSFSGFNISHS